MQRLLDSSKQNPTALRYFIQYEVLQKKTILDSYKTFCQVLGDDTMGYSEFEFCYWRFYNGDVDVDYDRSEDKKPLELLQLPVEIVDKVTKKLDPSSRVAVRNVCKALRTVIDSGKVNIEHIYLVISDTSFVRIDRKKTNFLEKNGLTPQQKLNLVIRFLQQLLINPKSEVEMFYMSFTSWPHSPHPSLKNLNQIKLNVKSLLIESKNPVSFKEIFSLFQPGVLEHITIDNGLTGSLDFNELSETEQFRQAKSVDMSKLGVVAPNRHVDHLKDMFSHFSSFHVSVYTVSDIDLIQLMEHFQQFATFDKFQLSIHSKTFDITDLFEDLAISLGVAVQEDGSVLGPIPGFKDYMKFSYEGTCIQMERKRC